MAAAPSSPLPVGATLWYASPSQKTAQVIVIIIAVAIVVIIIVVAIVVLVAVIVVVIIVVPSSDPKLLDVNSMVHITSMGVQPSSTRNFWM